MPDVDVEVLDTPSEISELNYPMAKGVKVEDFVITKGDLLYSPATENLDSTWYVVYGFNWGGIYLDSLTEFQLPTFYEWSSLVKKLKNQDFKINHLVEETSYYSDEDTICSLAYYRYYHDDGRQAVVTKHTRHPMETNAELQSVNIYETPREVIDDIYTSDAMTNVNEAEAIYQLLIDSGIREDLLSPPDKVASQSGLSEFSS